MSRLRGMARIQLMDKKHHAANAREVAATLLI
ncbi:MAG: hypothetical protein ACJARL_001242 [Halopseudomonas sp.]|jgi:hypothetical protein